MRLPTEKEMILINQQAKRPGKADDFMVFDAKPANDFMLTTYRYYLGTSSLKNFVADLDRERLRLGTSHKRDLNLGRWLPGEIVSVDTPEGARQGRSYQLQAPFYMPKGLTIGQYNTDELAKGIETGILTDISIEWYGGTPKCDICGEDVRNGEECPHIPGREYDGVMATFTVENAHLGACDLVDDGGLPLATLSDGEGTDWKLSGPVNMDGIKKLSVDHPMTGLLHQSLSASFAKLATSVENGRPIPVSLFKTSSEKYDPDVINAPYRSRPFRERPTLAELYGSRHPSLNRRVDNADLYRTFPYQHELSDLFRSGVRRHG